MSIKKAQESLKRGEFVLIYDFEDREQETDLVMAAEFATSKTIRVMRRDGGGLIILMAHFRLADKLGLPFLADIFYRGGARWPVLKELIPNDIPYDTKSSFSVPINHRGTFTGISDTDRALTISRFSQLARDVTDLGSGEAQRVFGESFRTPGHVPICVAAPGLLAERQGHTELGVALALMAGMTPVVTACEMIGEQCSLPPDDARAYAEDKNLVFIEGQDIVEAWGAWSE